MPSTDTYLRLDVDVDARTLHPTRAVLDIGDLDTCSEWDMGRKALMAFITELDPQSAGSDLIGTQPAQWLYAGVLISVQLVYGTPVIAFEGGCGRASIPLAQADLEELRARRRSVSNEVQKA